MAPEPAHRPAAPPHCHGLGGVQTGEPGQKWRSGRILPVDQAAHVLVSGGKPKPVEKPHPNSDNLKNEGS